MKSFIVLLFLSSSLALVRSSCADELLAGVAKVDITREGTDAGSNPPHVTALTLSSGNTHAVVVAIDAVAVAEIGSIRDPFLARVRQRLHDDLGLSHDSLLVNASHCHARVADDIEDRTVAAVHEAWRNRTPVRAGVATGHEDRIQIHRRISLKDGTEADERHAYALPADEDVAGIGPIDPGIPILRLDRIDTGQPLALVYQFACHPIQGIPSGGNTADLSGFASRTIEKHLGDGTAVALFLQGCGGDINPVLYKSTARPRDAEPLGERLALSTLEATRMIHCEQGAPLSIQSATLQLPREDHRTRIEELEGEIDALTRSLRGTTLNLKSFLALYVKYHLSGNYPSESAQQYLQDELLEKEDWKILDQNNRRAIEAYLNNIRIMEKITRAQINLALLQKHQARYEAEGGTVEAEIVGLRVGDFRLVTFPAELTVQIGLNIKEQAGLPHTGVSGYTNGYLFYAPTAAQLENRGRAQEDSDCLFAPGWQRIFEARAVEMLQAL